MSSRPAVLDYFDFKLLKISRLETNDRLLIRSKLKVNHHDCTIFRRADAALDSLDDNALFCIVEGAFGGMAKAHSGPLDVSFGANLLDAECKLRIKLRISADECTPNIEIAQSCKSLPFRWVDMPYSRYERKIV
jgi:hypothetical protein